MQTNQAMNERTKLDKCYMLYYDASDDDDDDERNKHKDKKREREVCPKITNIEMGKNVSSVYSVRQYTHKERMNKTEDDFTNLTNDPEMIPESKIKIRTMNEYS